MVPYILFFLLFIVPFIIVPFGVTQFEDPKVIISEIAIILMVFLFFFTKNEKHISSKLVPHVRYLFVVLGILTVFHLLVSSDQRLLLFGNAFRLQGIFLLWFMMIFSYISSHFNLPRIHWAIYIFILIAELLITVFLLPTHENGRYVGTMGEPNATAAYAIFVWPFAYFALKKVKTRQMFGLALILLTVFGILFLTHSRSAMISFFIQLVFLFLHNRKISLKWVVTICLSLITISYLLPFFDNQPFENRSEIWRAAFAANDSWEKILLGSGFGNIENEIDKSAEKLDFPIQDNYVDSAHNVFLDWWVQGGIVGLVILVGFIYFSLKNFIKRKEVLELVIFLGLLTVLSFNPASIASLLAFWWIIGKGSARVS